MKTDKNPLSTISIVFLPESFHGRLLSIPVFSADGHYLNNKVFLSRNYRLIVAPRKFDVLKTNICPKSEASRANMLVLRASNFQGATIRPIVPRHKHPIVFIVHHKIFFRTLVQKSIRLQLNYFSDFETKAVKAKLIKFEKENREHPLNTILTQFQFIFYETRLFTEQFSRTTTIHPGISADRHY